MFDDSAVAKSVFNGSSKYRDLDWLFFFHKHSSLQKTFYNEYFCNGG